MSIFDEIKSSYKYGGNLTRLTYINIGIFLSYNLLRAIFFIFNINVAVFNESLLAVPADLVSLLHRPWTLLTYMFFHENFLHILFNMLWLYWFGKLFLQFLSQTQLLWVYILGGFCGCILFIAAYNLLPAFNSTNAIALGASASVMAIVFAVCTLRPNFEIYLLFLGSVKLKYLALATAIIDVISIPVSNSGGHIAHLGGAFFGFFFAKFLIRNTDLTKLFGSFANISLKRKKNKMKVNFGRPENDWDYRSRKAEEQKEIDSILDKISRSGYSSLTKEERDTLFKMKN